VDRIMFPERLIGLEYKKIKDIPPLRCDKCKFIVGMPFIYEKENRKAFRVFQDAIVKKIRKMNNKK
jgi:hypothetical protein